MHVLFEIYIIIYLIAFKRVSQVSLCDIDSEIGEQVADELGVKYGRKNVLFCQCDVTDYPQYEGIIYETVLGLIIVFKILGNYFPFALCSSFT